jgi:uncharacterized membrane protein (UPF0127 family)
MPNRTSLFHFTKIAELLLVALAVVAGCSHPAAAPAAGGSVPAAAAPASHPAVVLPDGTSFEVELASDDATRQEGLMFRESLLPRHGMLFFFPSSEVYPFWMKNTIIPLDMIWIDDGGKAVHIESRVPPCTADPCPSYSPGVAARYVLELAGGEAEAHHLHSGDTLSLRNVTGVVVR